MIVKTCLISLLPQYALHLYIYKFGVCGTYSSVQKSSCDVVIPVSCSAGSQLHVIFIQLYTLHPVIHGFFGGSASSKYSIM